MTSFYATELESVFDNPETRNGMSVHLVNQNYDVIYSSVNNEVGLPLSPEIMERIQNQGSVTVIDNEYVVSVNSCGDDWNVICSVPTKIILSEKNEMQLYIYQRLARNPPLLKRGMNCVHSLDKC